MLYLPTELDRQLWQDIQQSEGEAIMAYVSSIERIGIEKGVLQGESRSSEITEDRLVTTCLVWYE